MRSKRERKQRSSSQKASKRKAAALSNALDTFAPDEDEPEATPEASSYARLVPNALHCVYSQLAKRQSRAKWPTHGLAPGTTTSSGVDITGSRHPTQLFAGKLKILMSLFWRPRRRSLRLRQPQTMLQRPLSASANRRSASSKRLPRTRQRVQGVQR